MRDSFRETEIFKVKGLEINRERERESRFKVYIEIYWGLIGVYIYI